MQEHVLAKAKRKAEALSDIIHGRPARTRRTSRTATGWSAHNGRLYYYLGVRPATVTTLFDVSVFDTATGAVPSLGAHVRPRATYRPRRARWQAENGWVQRFQPTDRVCATTFATRPLALATPTDFDSGAGRSRRDDVRRAAQLHRAARRERLQRRRTEGQPAEEDRVPAGDARDDAARRAVRRHDRPARRALRHRPRARARARLLAADDDLHRDGRGRGAAGARSRPGPPTFSSSPARST